MSTHPIEVIESDDPVVNPWRVALVRPDQRPAVRQKEEKYVTTFPHLIVREVIVFQLVVIFLSLMALFFDAPLEGIANPMETPNPAKAPWYFLGLQELLHYFPPIVAGVILPALVVIALVVIPYGRVNTHPEPLWARSSGLKTSAIGAALGLLIVLFAAFKCWPIVIPTAAFAAAIFAARLPRGSRFRAWLWTITLPTWIMTWFVTIATILTVIGTFFRGPGWSWIWPWQGIPRG